MKHRATRHLKTLRALADFKAALDAAEPKCTRCNGSGFDPAFDGDGKQECRRCSGDGKEPR